MKTAGLWGRKVITCMYSWSYIVYIIVFHHNVLKYVWYVWRVGLELQHHLLAKILAWMIQLGGIQSDLYQWVLPWPWLDPRIILFILTQSHINKHDSGILFLHSSFYLYISLYLELWLSNKESSKSSYLNIVKEKVWRYIYYTAQTLDVS